MRFFLNILFIISMTMSLTHCSVFSPVPYQPATTYELSIPVCTCTSSKKINKSIYVAPIQTYPGLGTSAMRYTTKPYEIHYYSKNRWIAPPAAMLQPLLVTHLQQRFTEASMQQTANTNIVLQTTLEQFEQVFRGDTFSEFRLAMRVDITQALTGNVIRSKTICIAQPVTVATPYGGVIAANKSVEALFCEIDKLLRS